MTAEELAKKLNGKKTGEGWIALCPAHDDNKPSLSISHKDGGGFLYRCHAGCKQEHVFKVLVAKGILSSNEKESMETLARKIWKNSAPLEEDSPGYLYLKNRGLSPKLPLMNIRYNPETYYKDEVKGNFPAVICAIKDDENRLLSISRVYITNDGRKAKVERPKKCLGSMSGGSVHIGNLKKSDTELHVCEGVETGLAIHESINRTVWAGLTAGNLKKIIIPNHVRDVHIWVDKDRSATGQTTAKELMQRLSENKRRVFIHFPKSKLKPEEDHIDWLDELNNHGTDCLSRELKNHDDTNYETSSGAWEPINKIAGAKLPKLPLESFPGIIRKMIEETSVSYGVCPNLPAMHALGVYSIACAKIFKVKIKADWSQPSNLFNP